MYKGRSGMWSWLFHRVSGLAILLFLFVHIVDISLLGLGPTVYNDGIALFDEVIVRLLSVSLVAAVFYHAFNGVRIMIIDFWRKGVRYQQVMFVVVLVLTIVVFIPFAYIILRPGLTSLVAWLFTLPAAHAASVSH